MPDEISYLDSQYTLVREVVAAACPEVVAAGGIYETDHAEMTPWEKMTIPYAVIAMGEMDDSDEYGNRGQQDVFTVPVEVWYIAKVDGRLSPVRRALERILDKFNVWPEEKIKVMGVSNVTWDKSLTPNQYFVAKGQLYRAGRITVHILIAKPFPSFEE